MGVSTSVKSMGGMRKGGKERERDRQTVVV